MNAVCLQVFVSESSRHQGRLTHEWLLDAAQALGIAGGSAFRAIAGFGRHGKLHEETFFELAGELAVKVEFVVDEELAEKLLDSLHAEDLKILYIRQQIEVAQI